MSVRASSPGTTLSRLERVNRVQVLAGTGTTPPVGTYVYENSDPNGIAYASRLGDAPYSNRQGTLR